MTKLSNVFGAARGSRCRCPPKKTREALAQRRIIRPVAAVVSQSRLVLRPSCRFNASFSADQFVVLYFAGPNGSCRSVITMDPISESLRRFVQQCHLHLFRKILPPEASCPILRPRVFGISASSPAIAVKHNRLEPNLWRPGMPERH